MSGRLIESKFQVTFGILFFCVRNEKNSSLHKSEFIAKLNFEKKHNFLWGYSERLIECKFQVTIGILF